ncbi:hypothetical protein D3C76_1023630 [compost metagenome]
MAAISLVTEAIGTTTSGLLEYTTLSLCRSTTRALPEASTSGLAAAGSFSAATMFDEQTTDVQATNSRLSIERRIVMKALRKQDLVGSFVFLLGEFWQF